MKHEKKGSTFTFIRPVKKRTIRKRLYHIQNDIKRSIIVRTTPPSDTEKRKHHISVCMIFKDEAPYLREWIEYHRLIGIDHFYLYDNNSSDDYEQIIAKYIEQEIVTLIKWPAEHAQVAAYEDCIRRFRMESDWIGFIDVDEFVVPVAADSFPAFLDDLSNCPAVLINWRFFGSGGMIDRDISGLVIEDFVVASEKLYTKGKCFYNTHYDYLWDDPKNRSMFHILWTNVDGEHIPPVDIFGRFANEAIIKPTNREIPVQLNHYAVKSFMEHREKNKKGDIFYDNPTHDDEVFYGRDERCSVADYRIYKYLTRLKLRLLNDGKDPDPDWEPGK